MSHRALPIGTLLTPAGATELLGYLITRVLGEGGFGITYLAQWMDADVAIKEYFPEEFAYRSQDSLAVIPRTGENGEWFRFGLVRFEDEARTLLKLKNERGVVRALNYLQLNGTAYLVMDYVAGLTLEQMVGARGALPEAVVSNILVGILEALNSIHELGYLHRDIKPANVLVDFNSRPVLLDFGSARHALGAQTKTLTVILSPGYAPYEQYFKEGSGRYSDLYSLGACIYRTLLNEPPAEASARMQQAEALARVKARNAGQPDPMQRAVELGRGRYKRELLETIDWMLQVEPSDRPQNAISILNRLAPPAAALFIPQAEQQTELRTTAPQSESATTLEKSQVHAGVAESSSLQTKHSFRPSRLQVTSGVAAIALLALAWNFRTWISQPDDSGEPSYDKSEPAVPSSPSPTSATQPKPIAPAPDRSKQESLQHSATQGADQGTNLASGKSSSRTKVSETSTGSLRAYALPKVISTPDGFMVNDMNDAGAMVGCSHDGVPYLKEPGTAAWRPLGSNHDEYCRVRINSQGHVAGGNKAGLSYWKEANSTPTPLEESQGLFIVSLTDRGDVLATTNRFGDRYETYVWSPPAYKRVKFEFPGYSVSHVFAMNDRGQVLASTSSAELVVWQLDGTVSAVLKFRTMAPLDAAFNSKGQVVFHSYAPEGRSDRGVGLWLWDSATAAVTAIPDHPRGWSWYEARISDSGLIAGYIACPGDWYSQGPRCAGAYDVPTRKYFPLYSGIGKPTDYTYVVATSTRGDVLGYTEQDSGSVFVLWRALR